MSSFVFGKFKTEITENYFDGKILSIHNTGCWSTTEFIKKTVCDIFTFNGLDNRQNCRYWLTIIPFMWWRVIFKNPQKMMRVCWLVNFWIFLKLTLTSAKHTDFLRDNHTRYYSPLYFPWDYVTIKLFINQPINLKYLSIAEITNKTQAEFIKRLAYCYVVNGVTKIICFCLL